MINFITSHIKLSKRIYLGYYLITALILILIFIIFSTYKSNSMAFHAYIDLSKQLTQIKTFISSLTEMERQSLIYTHEGYQSAGEQVSERYNSMRQQLQQQSQYMDESIKQTLEITKTHLDAYYNAFKQVKIQRERKKQLVRFELRQYAIKNQLRIEDLIAWSKNIDNREIFHQILTALLLIEINAYRYFDSLDSSYIDIVSEKFKTIQNEIRHIRNPGNTHALSIDEFEQQLALYRTTFFEAVQLTRGYLYLINVVMSAEAYEILYQSRKLASIVEKNSLQIENQFIKNIDNALTNLVLASAIFFIIISLFSYIIIKTISVPLNKLTDIFKLLTQGSREATIPAYKLDDEIGALTRAAESFKQQNNELEKKQRELKRSNDELEEFVYTVSHDLKSPLVTSMGFIGIIKKLSQQGKYEQAIEKLDKVVKSNERMSQLINDLLELSRVGRIDLDKRIINLDVLLKDFSLSHSERIRNSHLKLQINHPLPEIYANESRTLQVFENILSNVIKYAATSSQPELLIGAKETPESWQIYCKDNGPGIEAAYHEKIFGLFYRLDTNAEGTGIGLSIVKKIMKSHGGNIWVESSPPDGATFWIEYPKYISKEE